METRMGKNLGERKRGEFHYSNGDYNGVFWCARVFGFKFSSTLEGILYLYKLCLFR